MNPSTHAVAAPHSNASFIQNIAESLNAYEASARLQMPKTAIDPMDAMCAIARCGPKAEVTTLLQAHVNKRKQRKNPSARYQFSAALEAYALHVQTSTDGHDVPETVQQKTQFVQDCMYRAERNLLAGYMRDPSHMQADVYFRNNPQAARSTLSNVASRMTLASLHKSRLPPIVHSPLARQAPVSAIPTVFLPATVLRQPAALSLGQALPWAAAPETQLCAQPRLIATSTQPTMTTVLLGQPSSAIEAAQRLLSPELVAQPLPTATVVQPSMLSASSWEGTAGQMLPPPTRCDGSKPTNTQLQTAPSLVSASATTLSPPGYLVQPEQQNLSVVTTGPQASALAQAMTGTLNLSNNFLPELDTPSPQAPGRNDATLMEFLDTIVGADPLDTPLHSPCATGAQGGSKRQAEWAPSESEPGNRRTRP